MCLTRLGALLGPQQSCTQGAASWDQLSSDGADTTQSIWKWCWVQAKAFRKPVCFSFPHKVPWQRWHLYIHIYIPEVDESGLETGLTSVFNWCCRWSFCYLGTLVTCTLHEWQWNSTENLPSIPPVPEVSLSVSRTSSCYPLQKLRYVSRGPGEIMKSPGHPRFGVHKIKCSVKTGVQGLFFLMTALFPLHLLFEFTPWLPLKSPLAKQPLSIFGFQSSSKVTKSWRQLVQEPTTLIAVPDRHEFAFLFHMDAPGNHSRSLRKSCRRLNQDKKSHLQELIFSVAKVSSRPTQGKTSNQARTALILFGTLRALASCVELNSCLLHRSKRYEPNDHWC